THLFLSSDHPILAYNAELSRYRSFTPESTISDWEGTDLCLETLFDHSRPESSQSDSSDFELDKLFSSRALSPDSPVPQFRPPHMAYNVELSRYRSSTPESTISDWEGTDLCLEILFDHPRPESSQSDSSDFELDKLFSSRALSPDSPIPQFTLPHIGYDAELSRYRSSTPESTISDWEGTDLCLETLFDHSRPESSQSDSSDFELDKLFSSRALSPDSPVPQFRPPHMAYNVELSRYRSSTPESTISDWEGTDLCLEILFDHPRPESSQSDSSDFELDKLFSSRALSPDSPIPQFTLPHIGYDAELSRYRSFTPESTISDWEGTDLCLETLFDHSRPESSQSDSSDFELDKLFSSRALSPDSPVPQFRPPHMAYNVELSRYRSSTPESTISDWEGTDLCLEILFDHPRPESSQSDSSDFELDKLFSSRALSPDSPIPQFTLPHIGYDAELSRYRSSTPESTISDWEGTDLCLEILFDHPRPESSQSDSSDFELDKLFSSRALSPDSPVPQFRPPHMAYNVELSRYRSSTPESTISDWEGTDLCLEILFDHPRPESSQSDSSDFELDKLFSSRALSPDSPVPQFTLPHIGYDAELSRYRSFTPESTISDWEGTDLCLETLFDHSRPESSQSDSSDFELDKLFSSRALSPDSPVPQFTLPHIGYDAELSRYRSFTPESTISDWEGTDLCLETLFDHSRPESSQSDSSDFELDKLFSSRALSPDSPVPQFRPPHMAYNVELSRYRSSTPESTISDWEGTDLCLEILFDHPRPESSQSDSSDFELDKLFSSRALSPDSPIPQFTLPHIGYDAELSRYRSSTPESTISDWEGTDLCLEILFDHPRPESSQSDSSDFELDKLFSSRALSPYSPVPQFRPPHMAYNVELSRYRSSTPESTISDWEGTDLCLEILFDHSRPESSQSDSSDFELDKLFSSRALSADSPVPQFTLPHIGYDAELSRYRSFTPESTISDWEGTDLCLETLFDHSRPESSQSDSSDFEVDKLFSSRALSPDSPVPQFRPPHMAYNVELSRYRSSTPESTISDWEGTDLCLEILFDHPRPESSQSDSSDFELDKLFSSRALSPDSPVPQFTLPHIGYDAELSRYRSFTPESTISDWEGTDLCLETLFDHSRPESSQSDSSDFELDKLFSSRALSPDSPVPQFRPPHMAYNVELSRYRSSTPESTISDWEGTDLCLEILFDHPRPESSQSDSSDFELDKLFSSRALSPDSPIPQFTLPHIGYDAELSRYRSSTPESTISDWEGTELCLEILFDHPRPESSQSDSSDFELDKLFSSRALSPDSPVPQFRPPHMAYNVELSRYRSSTPESTISDWEGTDLCLEILFDHPRPESLQSDSSDFELDKLFSSRALSPDSPVPQFTLPHIGYDAELSRYRSFTPESTISDWEGTDLCLETLFDHSRPESSQSDSSDFELDKLFSSRALSPDSPVPQFRPPHMAYNVELSRYRSSTPESTISDWEGTDLCLEILFDHPRPESSQSDSSDFELDKLFSSRALSPDSPIPQFTLPHIGYDAELSRYRSSTPESTISDWEGTDLCLEILFDHPRPESSQSDSSDFELDKLFSSRALSPDSPVPQFTLPHIGYDAELSRYRSFTPESTISDWEGTDLCLETLFDHSRPESSQSDSSDFELDKLFSSRALSPDSPIPQFTLPHIGYDAELSRYRSFTPESTISDWEGTDLCLETLFDHSRPESSQSDSSDFELDKLFSSRALSPDSPVPQFRPPHMAYNVELSRYRSSTPESTISDWEGTDLCLEILFDHPRPESSQSDSSDFELDKLFSSRALSPDSPIPQFTLPHIGYDAELSRYRSSTPESTISDWEGTDLCLEILFDHPRPESSQSDSSDFELDKLFSSRALSPDSPVPQFRPPHMAYNVELSRYRSSTPESTISDWEGTDLCLEILFDHSRPESSQSDSSDFELDKLFSSRALSADSPVPQFTLPHIGYDAELSRYRSFTPESTISDWEGTDLCLETLFDHSRPESSQSDSSDFELDKLFSSRALSPDSPVPQFRPPHMAYNVELSRYRSSTPESTISDWEGTDLCLEILFDHPRPESSQSDSSDFELDKLFSSRALSPDSPVPQFTLPHIGYNVELSRYRSFTPESTISDWEGTDLCLETLFDHSRPVSSQSDSSDFELDKLFSSRALSPDSPVPQFRPPHMAYNVELSRYRSSTPESTISDWEGTDLCLEILFDHPRPESSQSDSSDFELDKLFSSRALSPDSPIPQFTLPHIGYDAELSRYRSSTPESTISDWEGTDLCLEILFDHPRPESSQSDSSDFELDKLFSSRALSPDSPVPQFRPPHMAYNVELSRYRSSTPESTISDWEGTDLCLEILFDHPRPESSQSDSSDFELDKLFSSRALSPDSPVPQFTLPHIGYMRNCQGTGLLHQNQPFQTGKVQICVWKPSLITLDQRARSQIHQTLNLISCLVAGHCLQTHLFLSSDHPIWLIMWNCQGTGLLHQNQPFQTGKVQICVWKSSLISLDQRARSQIHQILNLISCLVAGHCLQTHLFLSSDHPIWLIMWNCQGTGLLHQNQPFQTGKVQSCVWKSSLITLDQRARSQIHQILNLISCLVAGHCLQTHLFLSSHCPILAMMQNCQESSQSDSSDFELDKLFSSRALSPDSPVPQFRPPHMAYNVELSRYRSSTPESTISDWEGTELCLETLFDHSRPESSQSESSDFELDKLFSSRALSPDSPIPQFTLPHIGYDAELSRYRSFTPVSTISDWEGTDLCLETLFDQTRPDSPQSVLSDFELDRFFSGRALSPDSVSSDFDFSLLQDWLADFRPSSPESVASVEQHSFSPHMTFGQMKGQHCDYYLQYSESRPQSPLSTLSDFEYLGLCLEELFEDNRPDSPHSVSSLDEDEKRTVKISATQALPGARPFTYADVVRGTKYEKQAETLFSIKSFELKPFSLPSRSLDECSDSVKDNWVKEIRLHSAESVASQSDHRSLSPDSPVPQFRPPHLAYNVELSRYRSFTPESTISDWEGTDLCLETLFDHSRPESSQSDSSDFELDKLFSSRALSPDSPVPQFRPPHMAYNVELSRYRSSTPESTISDWEGTDLCLEILFDHPRPESSQSDSSDFELDKLFSSRALSPDSPIPQFTLPHIGYDAELSRYRSSTPESTISDWEGTDLCLETLFDHSRPESSQSESSDFELDKLFSSRALSPDSPIPQFRPPHMAYNVELSRYRSSTPESTISDWVGTDLCLETLFDQTRPDSPQSVLSDFELDRFFSGRALSPDSVSSDFDFSLLQDWLADFRPSSPESVASVEQHSFSPHMTFGQMKGQRCDYYLQYSEHTDFVLQSPFDQTSPQLPQLDSSHILMFNLSPPVCTDEVSLASPLNPKLVESDNCAPVYQGSVTSNDYPSQHLSISNCKSIKCDFQGSINDSSSHLDECCAENIPNDTDLMSWHAKTAKGEPSLTNSASSPKCHPHTDVTSMNVEVLDNSINTDNTFQFQPLSSEITKPEAETNESFIDYWLSELNFYSDIASTSNKAESLTETASFSRDVFLLQNCPEKSEPSSANDVASIDKHYLTPHITFDLIKNELSDYYLKYSESTPHSALTSQDVAEDKRSHSSDYIASHNEAELDMFFNGSSKALPPYSPVSQFRPPYIAYDVELSRHRSFTPESTISDWEGTDLCLETLFDQTRAESPQSDSSDFELDKFFSSRALSPDSPIPQFTLPHIGYDAELSRYRSFTPESTISDWEGTDLCLETLFDQTRPDSPQSVLSDFELDRFFSGRASSNFDFSLLQDWLADFRPSSPESVASVEQHSFSPHMIFGQMKGQCCDYYLQYSESRPQSPLSTLSDIEYLGLCLEELYEDNRPDSPDSVSSQDKPQKHSLTICSSELLPVARLLSYADAEWGSVHEKQSDCLIKEHTFSPSLLSSDLKPCSHDHSVLVRKSEKKLTKLKLIPSELLSSHSTSYTKEYRVTHKAFLNPLISHLYDPIYKGACSCCKKKKDSNVILKSIFYGSGSKMV
ncbi:uncharacterized protein LOC122979391 isoform X1, partial [Scomber scombrus]